MRQKEGEVVEQRRTMHVLQERGTKYATAALGEKTELLEERQDRAKNTAALMSITE